MNFRFPFVSFVKKRLSSEDESNWKLLLSSVLAVVAVFVLAGAFCSVAFHMYFGGSQAGGTPASPNRAELSRMVFKPTAGEARRAEELERSIAKEQRSRLVRLTVASAIAVLAIAVLLGSIAYSSITYRSQLSKLQIAEAQTRSILETTLDGVIIVDSQGKVRMMNPAAEQMFEMKAVDLLGKPISRIIPQRLFVHDISTAVRGTMMAMGQRGDYFSFPIEVSTSEIVREGQRQFVALIRDVSERRRSEETLRHIALGVSSATGEEFIRSLVMRLSKALQTDCAFILQASGRKDETHFSLTLAQQGQIRTNPRFELADTACERVLRGGYKAWTSKVREEFPNDELLEETDAQCFVAMPLTDHIGRVIGVLGVIDRKSAEGIVESAETAIQIFAARAGAEIERQHAEEKLAAEKEQLSVTLRSINEGCITIDVNGNVVLLNNVAEELTGWTQSFATGRPLTEVFHLMERETRNSCLAALRRLANTGEEPSLDTASILVASDGTERIVECSFAPIRDLANRRFGVVLVFRDITERLRIEEERRRTEKLESLGKVAGGIAHDFNNLLTGILGNLSLAMMSRGTGEALNERLSAAKGASLRAQDLAQQLLTFARGGAPIKKSEFIDHVVRDTVTFALHGTSARPEFDVPGDLWHAMVDTSQISQAITNITTNAAQAMPEGGRVFVSVENYECAEDDPVSPSLPSGRYVRIVIRDEGCGISNENLEKIFDPYFTTKPDSSGLGLATAYSIAKKHEGLLTVESEVGRGSTFSIYLPASMSVEAPAIVRTSSAPQGPGRVLVLDDEEVICEIVSCTLEDMGYTVTQAYDAATAIRLYKEALERGERFDVVISDLTIPGGMGGQEAIKRLLQIDPTVKAIVSSGYAMDPVMSRYQDFGFCACLAKPYEVSALGELVNEVYGGTPSGKKFEPAQKTAASV